MGAGGEGRTSHIKVAQKLDMLGIGAAHQKDPNGLAWKQNKDFENLLKRLNEANGGGDLEGEAGETGETGIAVDGFVKPKGEVEEIAKEEGGAKEKKDKRDKKKDRKEKKKDKDAEGEEKKKRKRDEESEDHEKKSKKKRKKSDDQGSSDNTESVKPTESKPTSPEPTPAVEQRPSRVIPRHRSYVFYS